MRVLALLALMVGFAAGAHAAPTDDIADVLVTAGKKADISPETLPADFARLTRFVRHDGKGMILFSDGGSTDGYVRHAQAQFTILAGPVADTSKMPLFMVALELVDQPDFTFEALSSALTQRLGTPTDSSNQAGATFRTWMLPEPKGRVVRIDRGQASDNGDPVIVVRVMQNR